MSVALLALATIYVAALEAWSRLGSPDVAGGLARSFAYRGLAALLIVDGVAAVARALRTTEEAGRRSRTPARIGRALLAAGWLLAGAAFATSLAARDRFVVRLAEGEAYVNAEEQFSGGDPPRPLSRGAVRERFTVRKVGLDTTGGLRDVVVDTDRGPTRASRLRPAWLAAATVLRPLRVGRAVELEVGPERGPPVERAYAKLGAAAGGAAGTILLRNVPYRVVVREVRGESAFRPRMAASVYRGKLAVAQGGTDAPLRFEGLVVTFTGWGPWVELELLRDPGVPLALVAALLGAVGWALLRRARAQPRRQPVASGGAP